MRYLVLLIMLVAVTLTSCRAQREVTKCEQQVTRSYESHKDTLREVQYKYDSIYIDSRQKISTRNDTVYQEQLRVEYRYRLLHDTIRDVKVVRCEDEKVLRCEEEKVTKDYIPWYARGLLWAGLVLVVMWFLCQKIKKCNIFI